jgi:hypothetical protein
MCACAFHFYSNNVNKTLFLLNLSPLLQQEKKNLCTVYISPSSLLLMDSSNHLETAQPCSTADSADLQLY